MAPDAPQRAVGQKIQKSEECTSARLKQGSVQGGGQLEAGEKKERKKSRCVSVCARVTIVMLLLSLGAFATPTGVADNGEVFVFVFCRNKSPFRCPLPSELPAVRKASLCVTHENSEWCMHWRPSGQGVSEVPCRKRRYIRPIHSQLQLHHQTHTMCVCACALSEGANPKRPL